MQPIRHGVIKRYFDKYKYQKKKRDEILAAVETSEAYSKEVLGPDYVHFRVALPYIDLFLAELEAKEKLMPPKSKEQEQKILDEIAAKEKEEQEVKLKRKETKIEEVEFDPDTFNPFDNEERKKTNLDEKPLQPRKLLNVKKK